ncbi:MAG: hypothetical protein M1829_000790 [Trizodia sp. TS-e1964]|nr:MAG: hypothetical protein M1829_000790 [Trizodia sp. TS-e1964]
MTTILNFLHSPFSSPSSRTLVYSIASLLSWTPALIFFNDNIYQIMSITGPSMSPELSPNYHTEGRRDRVLARMWKPEKGLERGMIVSFWSPINPSRMAVKRVVALEGDLVQTRAPYPFPMERVPHGHVWLEGDEEMRSLDSNTYGPVSQSLITARITHVLWPLNRAGKIGVERRSA